MVTVKVADLLKMAKELSESGYEYVEIDEMSESKDMAKCLHFEAYDGEGGGVDFEEIEHIEIDAMYKMDS